MSVEKFEQESSELREIEWVQSQVRDELKTLEQELFYTKEGETVTYNMWIVKQYLDTLKETDWKTLVSKNSSAFIMAVQIALESKWYDVGKIDGLWGSRTSKAVKEFQAAQSLSADGLPWPITISKIVEVLWGSAGAAEDKADEWAAEDKEV